MALSPALVRDHFLSTHTPRHSTQGKDLVWLVQQRRVYVMMLHGDAQFAAMEEWAERTGVADLVPILVGLGFVNLRAVSLFQPQTFVDLGYLKDPEAMRLQRAIDALTPIRKPKRKGIDEVVIGEEKRQKKLRWRNETEAHMTSHEIQLLATLPTTPKYQYPHPMDDAFAPPRPPAPRGRPISSSAEISSGGRSSSNSPQDTDCYEVRPGDHPPPPPRRANYPTKHSDPPLHGMVGSRAKPKQHPLHHIFGTPGHPRPPPTPPPTTLDGPAAQHIIHSPPKETLPSTTQPPPFYYPHDKQPFHPHDYSRKSLEYAMKKPGKIKSDHEIIWTSIQTFFDLQPSALYLVAMQLFIEYAHKGLVSGCEPNTHRLLDFLKSDFLKPTDSAPLSSSQPISPPASAQIPGPAFPPPPMKGNTGGGLPFPISPMSTPNSSVHDPFNFFSKYPTAVPGSTSSPLSSRSASPSPSGSPTPSAPPSPPAHPTLPPHPANTPLPPHPASQPFPAHPGHPVPTSPKQIYRGKRFRAKLVQEMIASHKLLTETNTNDAPPHSEPSSSQVEPLVDGGFKAKESKKWSELSEEFRAATTELVMNVTNEKGSDTTATTTKSVPKKPVANPIAHISPEPRTVQEVLDAFKRARELATSSSSSPSSTPTPSRAPTPTFVEPPLPTPTPSLSPKSSLADLLNAAEKESKASELKPIKIEPTVEEEIKSPPATHIKSPPSPPSPPVPSPSRKKLSTSQSSTGPAPSPSSSPAMPYTITTFALSSPDEIATKPLSNPNRQAPHAMAVPRKIPVEWGIMRN